MADLFIPIVFYDMSFYLIHRFYIYVFKFANNQRDKQIIGLFYLLSRYMFYLAIEIVNQSEKYLF